MLLSVSIGLLMLGVERVSVILSVSRGMEVNWINFVNFVMVQFLFL